jgi:hypothetical protein
MVIAHSNRLSGIDNPGRELLIGLEVGDLTEAVRALG